MTCLRTNQRSSFDVLGSGVKKVVRRKFSRCTTFLHNPQLVPPRIPSGPREPSQPKTTAVLVACPTSTCGITSPTRCAALSAMRRVTGGNGDWHTSRATAHLLLKWFSRRSQNVTTSVSSTAARSTPRLPRSEQPRSANDSTELPATMK